MAKDLQHHQPHHLHHHHHHISSLAPYHHGLNINTAITSHDIPYNQNSSLSLFSLNSNPSFIIPHPQDPLLYFETFGHIEDDLRVNQTNLYNLDNLFHQSSNPSSSSLDLDPQLIWPIPNFLPLQEFHPPINNFQETTQILEPSMEEKLMMMDPIMSIPSYENNNIMNSSLPKLFEILDGENNNNNNVCTIIQSSSSSSTSSSPSLDNHHHLHVHGVDPMGRYPSDIHVPADHQQVGYVENNVTIPANPSFLQADHHHGNI